jgi:hypothetical protein
MFHVDQWGSCVGICLWLSAVGSSYLLSSHVRFEVLTAVTMKNGVFWDVTPVLTRATRRNIPEDDILHLSRRLFSVTINVQYVVSGRWMIYSHVIFCTMPVRNVPLLEDAGENIDVNFREDIFPTIVTVYRLTNKIISAGILINKKQKHTRRMIAEETLDAVEDRLEQTSGKLPKCLAQEVGVSSCSVRTASQPLKPGPYRATAIHSLQPRIQLAGFIYGRSALTTRHPSIRKSWHLISPTSRGRSVSIVRLRTEGHGVCSTASRRGLAPIRIDILLLWNVVSLAGTRGHKVFAWLVSVRLSYWTLRAYTYAGSVRRLRGQNNQNWNLAGTFTRTLSLWSAVKEEIHHYSSQYSECVPKGPRSEPHGATRQQAIAKTPAKPSADQIISLIVLFVV